MLQANSQRECLFWIDSIDKAINNALNNITHDLDESTTLPYNSSVIINDTNCSSNELSCDLADQNSSSSFLSITNNNFDNSSNFNTSSLQSTSVNESMNSNKTRTIKKKFVDQPSVSF